MNSRREPYNTIDFYRGCAIALLLCIPFWGSIIALVWIANQLIGGG